VLGTIAARAGRVRSRRPGAHARQIWLIFLRRTGRKSAPFEHHKEPRKRSYDQRAARIMMHASLPAYAPRRHCSDVAILTTDAECLLCRDLSWPPCRVSASASAVKRERPCARIPAAQRNANGVALLFVPAARSYRHRQVSA
jgi:hypothetical protein